MGCLQTTFCIFNGIITILAAACVGIGAWALADKETFTDAYTEAIEKLDLKGGLPTSGMTTVAVLTIIIGTVIMVIAGIGCIGASKNSKCLLGVFFIAMIIICVAVIAVAVLVKFYPNKLREEMEKKYQDYFETGNGKQNLDDFQNLFKCCGINGEKDFEGKDAPESCNKYKVGCAEAFEKKISTVGSPLFIAAIVTLILLVLATGISGYLYCSGTGEAV